MSPGATWAVGPGPGGGTYGGGPVEPPIHDSSSLLDPCHKISQLMEVEAHGPPELIIYVWYVIHWGPLLDAQCFLLVREEVCEELVLHLYPFRLLIGGRVMLVVDLEFMLKVLSPSCAMVFGCQSHRVMGQSLHPTTPLRWSTFRCCSLGNIWCCP